MGLVVLGTLAHVTHPSDPRSESLNRDEKTLSSGAATGDALSKDILTFIKATAVKEAEPEKMSVFSRVEDKKVLVLVSAPQLKKFSDKARQQFLDGIASIAKLRHPDCQLYAGVKGMIFYGAVLTPEGAMSTETSAEPAVLLNFYGPPPSRNQKR
jgi:hypothetical protein